MPKFCLHVNNRTPRSWFVKIDAIAATFHFQGGSSGNASSGRDARSGFSSNVCSGTGDHSRTISTVDATATFKDSRNNKVTHKRSGLRPSNSTFLILRPIIARPRRRSFLETLSAPFSGPAKMGVEGVVDVALEEVDIDAVDAVAAGVLPTEE
jgi:hypothetical protein